MVDVAARIAAFNDGRDPERLRMKYAAMRDNPFSFLRGTCHLFYARLPRAGVLKKAPLAWISGDLHFENFGSYKGDNRLVYFDINDFDEACLAPCTWELVRLLASVLLGTAAIGVSRAEAMALCYTALEEYSAKLRLGKARWIERDVAEGMVSDLLHQLRQRTRVDLLDRRTELKHKAKRRVLRVDGVKALPATQKQRDKVAAFMVEFARAQPNPAFYRMHDVARRIAGTGSLGLDRYVILVEGKGSPNGNYLLDLKEATPSAVVPCLSTRQPKWASEAQRVVDLQHRAQAVSAAFLQPAMLGKRSYILRALQPVEDRVALGNWHGKLPRLELVIRNMGELIAWSHLRGSGRQGSATADELIEFGSQRKWQGKLMEVAQACAAQADSDWREYCAAYDDGAFGSLPEAPAEPADVA
jgi:uncharacterized protein (DUF2252 family)